MPKGFTAQESVVESLEDLRWELCDAEDDERQAVALREKAEAVEAKARQRRGRAEAQLLLVEKRLGLTKTRGDQVVTRLEGMTVTSTRPPLPEVPLSSGSRPASVSQFVDALKTATHTRAREKT